MNQVPLKSLLKQESSNLAGKTFLITGGTGKLANAFYTAIQSHTPMARVVLSTRKDLDVEESSAFDKFLGLKPDYVIHCAARVDADFCELNVLEAERNIVGGAKNVVEFANKIGAKLVYPQSFLIYDGEINPVIESTPPNPLSIYGKLKFEAEKCVEKNSDSLILRMGGFFGGGKLDTNFIGKFSRLIPSLLAAGNQEVEVGNRVWQPTYTKDLAENTLILLALEKSGVYIMAGHGQATFFEVASFMIDKLALDKNLRVINMQPNKTKYLDVASRPNSINMMNARLIYDLLDFQRDWRDALNEYLESFEYRSAFPF